MANSASAVLRWLIVTSSLVAAAPVDGASPWRFWNKADGLPESASFGLTSDSAGHILAKFGPGPSLAVLDGYQIAELPSRRAFGRLANSADKSIWTFDAAGIEVHDSSGWHSYPDREIADFVKTKPMQVTSWFLYSSTRRPEDRMDFVPLENNAGLILFPDRLVEWDRRSGAKQVIRTASQTGLARFRDIEASRVGFWVTGEKGLGHLTKVGERFEWLEFPAPAGRTDLVNPIEGAGGEVFVSALRPDGRRSLLRFADRTWDEVFAGDTEQLKGWRGPENEIWIQNGGKIIQLGPGRSGDLGGGRTITGLTTAVVTQPDQSFWLGTTEGLARYAPPLWRTPRGAAWAEAPVSAIVEDRRARIWFMSGQFLVMNDGDAPDHEEWRRYRLPAGPRVSPLKDVIVPLQNGDLAIRRLVPAEMIVFSPDSGKFRVVSPPGGKRIGFVGARRGGTAWVQVFEDDNSKWRLEIFDGTHFLPGGQPEFANLMDLRTVLEARNGDIWLGANDSLGRVRDSRLEVFDAKAGFTDSGAFSAAETGDGTVILGGRDYITAYDVTAHDGKSFRILRTIDKADSISPASDGFWAGSGSGIHRYRSGNWVTNTVDDGLPDSAVRTVYSDSRGRVWAGTSRGISLFHPEADPDPPDTYIIDDQNLRETPPGGEVRLVFSGMDKWKFTAADRLAFSWRLDNSAWSDFGPSHFASFRKLHSGSHQFAVRAMDRNGNIDPNPATYKFAVLLPWYRETEFLILACLAAFLIAGLSRLAWRHHRRLSFQSRHDSLTGLANRTVLELSFQSAIAEARAGNTLIAYMLLDLDRFKPINDTFGHVVGDRFLQEVSGRLRSAIRKEDTLARLGGDEFAILMPGVVTLSEVESMARKILDLLRRPYQIESFELAGSASIGISLFPEHGEDAAMLQRLADMAMYQCKARNKDSYAIFDPDTNHLDFRSAQMAGLIREALDKNHFQLLYQPLRAINEDLVGFEALIRLEHPVFGTILPNDFISLAEDTGLIVRVGNWVMGEACRQMACWHAAGHRKLRINVNVSTVQLAKPDFAENVMAILAETALDPRALTLEITETAMMHSWKESLSQIEQLREIGVTIALDDFGTGYSTLSSLHLLPVDYIKVDRSFIERLEDETSDASIVIQAITQLVHRFGFKVVAEGVELPRQLSCLRLIGCDLFQGYLLGKPLPAESAGRLIRRGELPEPTHLPDGLMTVAIEA